MEVAFWKKERPSQFFSRDSTKINNYSYYHPCKQPLDKDFGEKYFQFQYVLRQHQEQFDLVKDLPEKALALRAEFPWSFQVGKGSACCHAIWGDSGACGGNVDWPLPLLWFYLMLRKNIISLRQEILMMGSVDRLWRMGDKCSKPFKMTYKPLCVCFS